MLSDNAPMDDGRDHRVPAVLAPFGERALPTVHHLAVRDGADPAAVADAVEAALLARGVEAKTYAEILDDAVGANMLFIRLVQGFMALGLVVGVAALGVISARAVVERRQQLGMLRAIGFQPEMIRRIAPRRDRRSSPSPPSPPGRILGLVPVLQRHRRLPAANSATPTSRFAVPWLNLASSSPP